MSRKKYLQKRRCLRISISFYLTRSKYNVPWSKIKILVKYLIKLFYLSSFSPFFLLSSSPFLLNSLFYLSFCCFSLSLLTRIYIYINSNFTFIYEFGRITFSSFLSILDLFFFSITYPIFYLSLFFYSFICHFRSLLFQLEFHLNSNILFLLCTRVSQRTISAFDERMYTSRSINFDLRSIFSRSIVRCDTSTMQFYCA